jgi:membrane associated rhomboid family serine protease
MTSPSPSTTTPFLFAITPLLLAHTLTPPLAYFSGQRLPPSSPLHSLFHYIYSHITPPSLLHSLTNVLALTLDPEKDCSVDRIAPWFTHIFIHATYEHMLLNLQSLVVSSYPIHSSLGTAPMLVLFLMGGAVSEYPTALHAHSHAHSQQRGGGIPGTALLPKALRSRLHSLLSYFRREVHCGSSGGVCSLLGSGGALLGLRVLRLLGECHHAGCCATHTLSLSHSTPHFLDGRRSSRHPVPALSLPLRVWNYAKCFTRRLLRVDALLMCTQVVSQVLTISREVHYLTAECPSGSSMSINYAAHVQGYIFGFLATVGLLATRSSTEKDRR